MSNLRKLLLSASIVSSALFLTACITVVPDAAPLPTPTASPSTTPSTPDVPNERIVITTLSIDVYSDDALADSWPHADRNPAEISALTDYFGVVPVVSTETWPGEGSDVTFEIQSWPGFEIRYVVSEFGPKNFFVTATAASVGTVDITAAGGAQVGDDLQALAASDPAATSTVASPDGDLMRVKLDQIPTGSDGYDGAAADFVSAQSLTPFATVTTIYAPQKNYGL